ncbi:Ig-like domain-containing protein [Aeromonas sp.]|uniref:Ig-like domain-containing protein n=1 Tax=Aeromonas sp. TaxID=647 RepID=UPI002584296C|nr:Ig-like domain-containing protein [Aeromonas sp.]MCX7132123.1 Ig-like domain-containing protein [Aeromonas sp.]
MLKVIIYLFLSCVFLFGCSKQHRNEFEHGFIERLQITPASPSIAAGLSQQMKAVAILSDGYTRDVTTQVSWISSDASVATVTPEGAIKALVPEQATITASVRNPDNSNVFLDVPVTIRDAVVTSLQITPASPSITSGLAQGMSAIATLSDGQSRDVSSQVHWVSSDSKVATALTLFKRWFFFRGNGAGVANITATLNDISSSAIITGMQKGYTIPSGLRILRSEAINTCSSLPTTKELLELYNTTNQYDNANICEIYLWPMDGICSGSTNSYWVSDDSRPFDMSLGQIYTGVINTANFTCILK